MVDTPSAWVWMAKESKGVLAALHLISESDYNNLNFIITLSRSDLMCRSVDGPASSDCVIHDVANRERV